MATLLFYQKPVQLSSEVHLQARLRPLSGDFSFAKETNSVPIAAVEFFDTAREYPIAFTGKDGGALFPIALMGMRQNENLVVTREGRWDGRYIPAFVRRYPFVLAEQQGADDFNVCVDEAYAGFGAANGERLFTDSGEHTPLLKQALEFLGTYQGEIKRTRLFVERLQALDLLVPRVVEVVRGNSPPMVLEGFSVVDEARLSALADKDVLELFRSGWLPWIHAHLLSLGNVSALAERLAARVAAVPEPAATAPPVAARAKSRAAAARAAPAKSRAAAPRKRIKR